MYPIKVVARRTGLSPEVLRAWERRYDGVAPQRDASGRRVYSAGLLARLEMLAEIVRGGYRISDVVDLSEARLIELLGEVRGNGAGTGSLGPVDAPAQSATRPWSEDPEGIDAAVEAVIACDSDALRAASESALVRLGRLDIADGFVFPVMKEIKRLAARGTCRAYHVTFARSTLRTFLSAFLISGRPTTAGHEQRLRVLVATPPGYASDLGVIASAVHVQAAGWEPVTLGAEICAEDLVVAQRQSNADALLVTAVSERYDPGMAHEMIRVRSLAEPAIPVYFGGRLPDRMVADLSQEGLLPLSSMAHLRETLEQQREVHLATTR